MYLDYSATTPLKQEVKDYIISILDSYGNPSSKYELGYKAREIVYSARKNVSNFINADIDDIIFTSSGSASNTLAIKGITDFLNKNYILYYSPISHKSMIKCCEDCLYSHELKINDNGEIDLNDLKRKLINNRYEKNVVCIEAANSEIGLIRDVKKIAEYVHSVNGIIIVDFTGYIPSVAVDVKELDVDIATFSAHKLGALKGVGVLYKKNCINLLPLIYGSQEQGLFGGTENVVGIASLGVAVKNYNYSSISSENRDYVYKKLLNEIPDCYLIGAIENRLPNNLYMCFKGIDSSSFITMMDMAGYQLSTGSACNNYTLQPPLSLVKLGVCKDDLNSCVRFSFSGNETKDKLDKLCRIISDTTELIRK